MKLHFTVLVVLVAGTAFTTHASAAPSGGGNEHTGTESVRIPDGDELGDGVRDSNGDRRWYYYEAAAMGGDTKKLKAGLTCETSHASPTLTEIDGLASRLYKENGWDSCTHTQGNIAGSMCVRLASFKGGDVSICGTPWKTIPCKTTLWTLNEIKNKCASHDIHRAGGKFWYPNIEIFVAIH